MTTTYTVTFAQDVPHYGAVEIEAENLEDATQKARDYWDAHTVETPAYDPDWSATVCPRIVSIESADPGESAHDIRLDDTYLGTASDAALRVRDAAPKLLVALKKTHADVLALAATRDPDQFGLWDALFTPAKVAIAEAEGRSWRQEIATFDGLEIHPVRAVETGKDGAKFCEQCASDEAQFWSVYGHLRSGGVLCLEDFSGEGDARAFADALLDEWPHLRAFGLWG